MNNKGRERMNNIIKYHSYHGTVEIDTEKGVFFGIVLGVRTKITYKGETAKELMTDFRRAINNYIEACIAKGVVPEQSFKGKFTVHISPEIHLQAAIYAAENDITLNGVVEDAVRMLLSKKGQL